ncbi:MULTISPECIES: DUF4834 domain-containing protein [unclassified Spirosoma]|uniref:DUF4834 domain-containing protein n=1 Tax=unclassified Spirosoma TaxID=2621999 RepID=UPI000963368D|nr:MULTISPECIES: DUF4834 domain-containing protein [unclassified Spirosoma]MBN8824667.1 DUF4834 domain-containing protein [Spirosoma sp.]OJW78783.1 MAG: DUF4834 domain-containing protein [Spirosoma sp. 48-14]
MLLKYLFIITLIILFVPPVRRFVFYLLVGRQLVKEQKRQGDVRGARREGDIRVDNRPQENGSRFKGGDYVDYEEVK